jgi:hypothetical protein
MVTMTYTPIRMNLKMTYEETQLLKLVLDIGLDNIKMKSDEAIFLKKLSYILENKLNGI